MMDNEATIPSSLASTEAENVDTETGNSDKSLSHINRSSNSPETTSNQLQSNNPFRSSTLTVSVPSLESVPISQLRTRIANAELVSYPFKTLNRILDDLKWTIPVQEKYNFSMLNSKPIDYSEELSKVVNSSVIHFETLILNNDLEYCKSVEKVEYSNSQQVLYIMRGILLDKKHGTYHFRLAALETDSNPFVTKLIDKHQYHVIPKSSISAHDLQILLENTIDVDKIIDDAFFKSLNSPNGQILRVTLFKAEFTQEDLVPLTDEEIIRERYLEGIKRHPNLSPETIPNQLHCIKTLIKVLRGPVTLKPEDTIKTINLKNTVMDAQIDVNLLFEKLSFTLNGDEAVPPDLNNLPDLKESYIRKILELIFFAKNVMVPNNEFQTLYSFSDNMSQVFHTIVEYDKNVSVRHFSSNYSNRFPYFINLSASAYFSDELIIKCFELTVQSDSINQLYYVDSLKQIRSFRNNNGGYSVNNKLDIYFRQRNLIGYSDFLESMKILGLAVESNETETIDDDVIIAMYRSQFKNDPKNYQYYNNHLKRIAGIKNSEKLDDFIQKELLPIDLALEELSIEEITEDDVVITAYEFKLDELLQLNGFNGNANEVIFLNKALLSVAVHRRSYILLEYLETKLPDYVKIPTMNEMTTRKAFETLDIDVQALESEIISNFQNKFLKGNVDIRLLRYALKLIAESKKSEILLSFLRTGKIDTSLLPAQNWPAGLDNIGNTCYLNSLLQYYFCIKPLRELILTFNENNFSANDYPETRKIGGRKVENMELQRSNQFVYQLRRLFQEMIYSNKRCVQPSKELAYLSFLPLSQPVNFKNQKKTDYLGRTTIEENKQVQLAETKDNQSVGTEFVHGELEGVLYQQSENGLSTDKDVTMTDGDDEINTEVKDIIDMDREVETGMEIETDVDESNKNYSMAVESPLSSRSMIEDEVETPDTSSSEDDVVGSSPKILPILSDQIESTIEVGRQQDVTECIENVTYQIETALPPQLIDKDGEQHDLIKQLFCGKTKQTITPLDKPDEPPRVSLERFFSLIINVSDHPKSIYDALDYYFNEDVVKLDEGLVKKSITILELPQILQFHVQRVLFDREKLMAYKSIEPIPFSDKIFLDRYLDTDDEEILYKRNQVFEWKREILKLQQYKSDLLKIDPETSVSLIDSLKITEKYLENKIILDDSLSIELSTIQTINDEIRKLTSNLEDIDNRLNELNHLISIQFQDYKSIAYNIFAVFIHRGEASYGHYWVYIKDPHNNNIFRKYNDEIVTEVPASEIFNFLETNTATPYYIVYIKEELESSYIEPLKREIKE